MKPLFDVQPVNRTICQALGESYEDAVEQKLGELKTKFIARMTRAGKPDPEGDWQRAEETYRNMLKNDPDVRSQMQSGAGGDPGPQRTSHSRMVRPQGRDQQDAPAGGGGGNSAQVGQEIYGLADKIRSSVGPEVEGTIHQIMQLAMTLTQGGAA